MSTYTPNNVINLALLVPSKGLITQVLLSKEILQNKGQQKNSNHYVDVDGNLEKYENL